MTTLCHFSHRRGAHKSNQNRNHHALLWISDTVSFNKICKYFAVNWFSSFILLSPYLLFMTPPPHPHPTPVEAQRWGVGWVWKAVSFPDSLQLVLAQCYASGNKSYLWKSLPVSAEVTDRRQDCFHWFYPRHRLSRTPPHVPAKEKNDHLSSGLWHFSHL